MRIDLILPVNNSNILTQDAVCVLNLPADIHCEIKRPENNLLEITNAQDEAKAIPSILKAIQDSADEGADAAIVYCFGEPGVEQAKSRVSIPVFGIASPAMHMASQLGCRFSVIASMQAHCPLINALAERFGLITRMSDPVSINISPNELINNDELLFVRVTEVIKQCFEKDHVNVFVLGCGSMQLKGRKIQQLIKAQLGYDIIVIDPLLAAIYFTMGVVKMKRT